jgi:uncharacterized membrane protein
MIYLISGLIILGAANAAYLYWQHYQFRKNNRQMVCPVGGKCEEVVDSKYGKTMGISNDLLGIIYYIGLTLILSVHFYVPGWSLAMANLAILAISFSFLFTLYLLFIQVFILKKWCFWCLISAAINIVIFVIGLIYFS